MSSDSISMPKKSSSRFRCVSSSGVSYRRSMDLSDRVAEIRGPEFQAVICADEVAGGAWLKCEVLGLGTLFLPMKAPDAPGGVLFIPVEVAVVAEREASCARDIEFSRSVANIRSWLRKCKPQWGMSLESESALSFSVDIKVHDQVLRIRLKDPELPYESISIIAKPQGFDNSRRHSQPSIVPRGVERMLNFLNSNAKYVRNPIKVLDSIRRFIVPVILSTPPQPVAAARAPRTSKPKPISNDPYADDDDLEGNEEGGYDDGGGGYYDDDEYGGYSRRKVKKEGPLFTTELKLAFLQQAQLECIERLDQNFAFQETGNPFLWRVMIFQFTGSIRDDLESLERRYGDTGVELELNFESTAFPCQAPCVTLLKPKFSDALQEKVAIMKYLQTWSPFVSIYDVLSSLYTIINDEANAVDMSAPEYRRSRIETCIHELHVHYSDISKSHETLAALADSAENSPEPSHVPNKSSNSFDFPDESVLYDDCNYVQLDNIGTLDESALTSHFAEFQCPFDEIRIKLDDATKKPLFAVLKYKSDNYLGALGIDGLDGFQFTANIASKEAFDAIPAPAKSNKVAASVSLSPTYCPSCSGSFDNSNYHVCKLCGFCQENCCNCGGTSASIDGSRGGGGNTKKWQSTSYAFGAENSNILADVTDLKRDKDSALCRVLDSLVEECVRVCESNDAAEVASTADVLANSCLFQFMNLRLVDTFDDMVGDDTKFGIFRNLYSLLYIAITRLANNSGLAASAFSILSKHRVFSRDFREVINIMDADLKAGSKKVEEVDPHSRITREEFDKEWIHFPKSTGNHIMFVQPSKPQPKQQFSCKCGMGGPSRQTGDTYCTGCRLCATCCGKTSNKDCTIQAFYQHRTTNVTTYGQPLYVGTRNFDWVYHDPSKGFASYRSQLYYENLATKKTQYQKPSELKAYLIERRMSKISSALNTGDKGEGITGGKGLRGSGEGVDMQKHLASLMSRVCVIFDKLTLTVTSTTEESTTTDEVRPSGLSAETLSEKAQLVSEYVSVMAELKFINDGNGDFADSKSGFGGSAGGVGFPQELASISSSSKVRTKALRNVHVSMIRDLPLDWGSSIWVRVNENRMDAMQVMISGPEGTPYSNGLFLFDVIFPADYPRVPPKVILQTTGRGSVRFNPNLYNEGKVCLSLLGTWPGSPDEMWSEDRSTFIQVLVSIQSAILGNEEPFYNEPGYERERGTPQGDKHSSDYNSVIEAGTVQWAIIDMMKNPIKGFEEVVYHHFRLKEKEITAQVASWESCAQFTTPLRDAYTLFKSKGVTSKPSSKDEATSTSQTQSSKTGGGSNATSNNTSLSDSSSAASLTSSISSKDGVQDKNALLIPLKDLLPPQRPPTVVASSTSSSSLASSKDGANGSTSKSLFVMSAMKDRRCELCTMSNTCNKTSCATCGSARIDTTSTNSALPDWKCEYCTMSNAGNLTSCDMCQSARVTKKVEGSSSSSDIGTTGQAIEGGISSLDGVGLSNSDNKSLPDNANGSISSNSNDGGGGNDNVNTSAVLVPAQTNSSYNEQVKEVQAIVGPDSYSHKEIVVCLEATNGNVQNAIDMLFG